MVNGDDGDDDGACVQMKDARSGPGLKSMMMMVNGDGGDDDDDGACVQVKDARSGPGLKSMTRIKSRQVLTDADYICDVPATQHDSPEGAKLHAANRSAALLSRNNYSSSMFIDSDYWTP